MAWEQQRGALEQKGSTGDAPWLPEGPPLPKAQGTDGVTCSQMLLRKHRQMTPTQQQLLLLG